MSRPSGRDISISSELLRATPPTDSDILGRVVHTSNFVPKPSARRVSHSESAPEPEGTPIDLEQDAEFLRTNPAAFMLHPENADHVFDKVIAFDEEERKEVDDRQDALASELRDMYMRLSADFATAGDRASAEFTAIMRDVYGVSGVTVDDTLLRMSSVVLDLESLALLLGKAKHLPAETKAALLQHASTQLYDDMVSNHRREANSKKRIEDIQRALLARNSGLAVNTTDAPPTKGE